MNEFQVVDECGWLERMNVQIRHIGIGMTNEDVKDFSRAIDISALRDYHHTVEMLEDAPAISFDQVLIDDQLNMVLREEGAVEEKNFTATSCRNSKRGKG